VASLGQGRFAAPTPAIDSENAPRWRISCRVDQRAGEVVESFHSPRTSNRLTRPEYHPQPYPPAPMATLAQPSALQDDSPAHKAANIGTDPTKRNTGMPRVPPRRIGRVGYWLRVVLVVVAHRRLGPNSSATTSTVERAVPSSAVQARCWSGTRPLGWLR
jgi:hypothetical protein